MKIETKKNIGDTVFFLKDGKILSFPIHSINTESKIKDNLVETEVKYWIKIIETKGVNYDMKFFKENEIFDSREQLIESL